MVDEKFGKRIQELMDYYNLSASAFADSMSVGRSSISHILSGRNKPSLDFVMKIEEAFPEVTLHWLLYGQGDFPKSENESPITEHIPSQKPIASPPIHISTEAVSEVEKKTSETNNNDLFSQTESTQEKKSKSIPPVINNPATKNNNLPIIPSDQEIDRIVIFYSDGTFNSYQMKKT